MKWFALIFCFSMSLAQAVTVAVIDTGFDLDHEVLRPRLKLGETDEEGAIALPGFSGWNFQNNGHLKTPAIPGEVLQEVLMYRDLKAKSHAQGLSPEERTWLEQKTQDPTFKDHLKRFKKHVHGTLVTGILLSEGQGIDVFPVRGLGIEVPAVVVETGAEPSAPILKNSQAEFYRQVKLSKSRVIRKMRKMLSWIHLHHISVVNASYGVTEKHIIRRFAEWHKEITGLELDEIKLKEVVDQYFASLYHEASEIIARYPNTLFIFSAGNSAQNNDLHHHFPSRVRRDNVISVAALNGDYLASFSNWGKDHVDVAAPGVGVMSLVPSVYNKDGTVTQTPASGTSMAAPSVANLAARCLQTNPRLTASELKRIIMETGQPLLDLQNKTVSGKMVDVAKALKTAALTKEMSLDEALKLSSSELIPAAPKEEDVAKKLLNTLPKTAPPVELDEEPEVTPSSPSSSLPDPETKTPDTSLPPAPVTPVAPVSEESLPTESAP